MNYVFIVAVSFRFVNEKENFNVRFLKNLYVYLTEACAGIKMNHAPGIHENNGGYNGL